MIYKRGYPATLHVIFFYANIFFGYAKIFLQNLGASLNFKNYDDELKKIKAGKTRSEKSFHQHIFFGGSTKFSSSQVKNATNPRGSKQVVVKMISNLPKSSVKGVSTTLCKTHTMAYV